MVVVVALVGLRQKEIQFPYPAMLMHGQRSSHHALLLHTRLFECCLPCCGSHPGLPVATFVVVVALPMVALMAIVIESRRTPPGVALLVIVIVIAASLRLRKVHARESQGCFAN